MTKEKKRKYSFPNISSPCIKGSIMASRGGDRKKSSARKDLHRDKVERTAKQHHAQELRISLSQHSALVMTTSIAV